MDFRPHSRTKTELAILYFPDEEPRLACRHLMRWINKCTPLVHDLRQLGYNTRSRHFTAAQVKKIAAHLGTPDTSDT